jgi:hypothetical protein
LLLAPKSSKKLKNLFKWHKVKDMFVPLKKLHLTIFFILSVFLSLALSVAYAWPKDHLMELTIITDKQEEFVHIVELTERQVRDLRQDLRSAIKPYLVEARKKYADEIGYRHEIYGDENYKMVVIDSYKLIVKDKSSGRIVLRKR